MLETADQNLISFFDELYAGTSPNNKSDKTNENNKKKLVSLCYFLASINNKYVNGLKADIGSYLQTAGTSASSIDTLNNLGFSVTRKTVDRQKLIISDEHQESKQFLIEDSYENRMESLTIHNYDGRIQYHQELRSMVNSKLIDFILHSLHSTKDYIEYTNLLFKVFERLKNNGEQDYLSNCIIPTICDWPGQVNIRRAITLRNDKRAESGIPLKILSLIPIIGPLHISLNSQETLFQTYHFFFEMLYHNLFGWKKIRNVVINRFGHSKDAEYRMMIDLLDNSIPLTLDIYTVLFKSGFFEGYLESIVRIWILFQRLRRHNYNKAPLIFLSDNYGNSQQKKTSLFLLDLFNNIFHNIGNTQQINRKKFPNFSLPTFNINVDVKVLPLAWNTETKPSDDKFCDAEKCLLSNNSNNPLFNNIVLTCGYAYHKQCYLLKNNSEDKNNSNLNEDIDNDEDIENILERIESNIDNQFEISYQTWLDYDSIQ
ncbi:unnamed protein product [Rhizophagus irregularis]|nr:unnamed protein product [Rhizophagus irregularis]